MGRGQVAREARRLPVPSEADKHIGDVQMRAGNGQGERQGTDKAVPVGNEGRRVMGMHRS